MISDKQKKMTDIEVSAFCGQISMILKSGISSLEGITIMLDEAEGKEEKELLTDVLSTITETSSLYTALSETGVFPEYMLNMIRIGEETGTLDDVTEQLSVHYEREDAISRSIRNAVTYPAVMAVMMLAVILVLLVRVMPIFNQVYAQLGTEMTGVSRVLMNIGTAIGRSSTVLIIIAAVLVILGVPAARTKKGRKILRSLGRKLAVSRSISDERAALRFAGGMALTLGSGIDIDRSIELASALNSDPEFAKKLDACKQQVQDGGDFAKALSDNGIFSGVYAHMASIGNKTGSLSTVMGRIADLYRDDIDTRMNNILASLEPTLVIVLSLIVGLILMSVMLPLMGIISGI